MIILGCFLCSLILHLNLAPFMTDHPGLLRHSLIGSWIVGTMCAYLYADQIPAIPLEDKKQKERGLLFTLSIPPRIQRLIGIMALWTILIGSLSACIYLRTGTLVWETLTLDSTAATASARPAAAGKHDYLQAEDRIALESRVLGLLFISADDIDRAGLSSQTAIDMQGRRKYFSEDGWQQYQKYVAAQKRRLIEAQGTSARPLKVHSELVDGTRKFKTMGDERDFMAEGIFLDGADSTLSRSDAFKMHIGYAPAGASGEVLINTWSVASENLK